MSCPHIFGIASLLKSLHPDWSPAAIKSAIMTSASSRDNSGKPITNGTVKATPFDYGAGHVRPNRAMDPGLVYDLNTTDYLHFLCAIGYDDKTQIAKFSDKPYECPESFDLVDFNYPSITVPNLNGSVTITRRVKNVGGPNVTYNAVVKSPPQITVSVEPKTLKFEKTLKEKEFKVTLKAKRAGAATDYVFGSLFWTDGKKHHVRSTIVVKSA
ncbi:hypothetical protein Sjap_003885 [Stephania japonica]|uniref:Uncharacterized protein n=1 Tax=Stephania japonica TaxID=461633 RepID=A0AAP0KSA0_9MAGN